MALLFQNWKMLIISLVPNVVPLLLAGALLGFIGIELEAGISVVFAIVFGIAVDDTIHFLSKFKLSQRKGLSVDEALKITFLETGKAICLTTIILFFGFLIMLFSVHPPSVSIGLLISVTLFSAVFADLLLIPILIRWLL
jgi:predicted RND superfamily exporter protein